MKNGDQRRWHGDRLDLGAIHQHLGVAGRVDPHRAPQRHRGLGANRTIFHRGTIELPVSFVQSVGDTVVLTVDVEQLREVHRAPATDAAPQPST